MPPKKAMTKAQIVAALAENSGLTKKQVADLLEDLANLAYREAKLGFTVPGMGKLVLVNRKARKGRNPATGEEIQIPAKKVLKFRIAKAAKDAITPKK
jgi:DNA-binding protein HU-beta